jgi:hypothetical protein
VIVREHICADIQDLHPPPLCRDAEDHAASAHSDVEPGIGLFLKTKTGALRSGITHRLAA